MINIPTPEFIVLYNGKEEFPDYKEMRLSDSFEIKSDTCYLELMAKVYNINKGRNADMASRSPVLSGYEEFIAEIKSNLDSSMNLADAIKAAIKTCLNKNILVDFLREHGSEVENMIFGEWNWDEALAVKYEEGVDTGVGIGVTRTAKNMLAKGYSDAEVIDVTNLSPEQVGNLRQT